MDEDTLNNILQNKAETDLQINETEVAKPNKDKIINETTVYCDEPGCDSYFSGDMAKAQLGRHKSTKHGIHNTTSPKKVSANKIDDDLIPTTYNRLEMLLSGYGIKGSKGIMQSVNMHNVEAPTFIPLLKDLLRSTGTSPGVIQAITDSWSMIIGQKPVSTEQNTVTSKPDFTDDMMAQAEKKAKLDWVMNMYGGGMNQKQSVANPELEAIKSQMTQLQASNTALQQQLTQQATDNKIAALTKALEESNRANNGQIGSVMENMKEFAQSITNMQEKVMLQNDAKFEKLLLQMQHKEEINEYKNRLDQANSSKPMGEKMIDLIDKKVDAIGQGFGAAMKETIGTEKADSISRLIQNGIPAQQAMSIVGVHPRPILPNAEQEYINLASATQQLEIEQASKLQQQKPPEPQPEETKPIDYSTHVRFNSGD